MPRQKTSSSKVDSRVELEMGDAVLTFDPAAAVHGIVYHLLDEKLAKSVAPENIKHTIERLAASGFKATIARSLWNGMTNPQRLEWLQHESQTISLVGTEDVVSLRARRVK